MRDITTPKKGAYKNLAKKIEKAISNYMADQPDDRNKGAVVIIDGTASSAVAAKLLSHQLGSQAVKGIIFTPMEDSMLVSAKEAAFMASVEYDVFDVDRLCAITYSGLKGDMRERMETVIAYDFAKAMRFSVVGTVDMSRIIGLRLVPLGRSTCHLAIFQHLLEEDVINLGKELNIPSRILRSEFEHFGVSGKDVYDYAMDNMHEDEIDLQYLLDGYHNGNIHDVLARTVSNDLMIRYRFEEDNENWNDERAAHKYSFVVNSVPKLCKYESTLV